MSIAARKAAEPHQRSLQSEELLEATEKCNDALVNVLKQACSRNRALERKALWSQKDKEDHGSRSSLTLKSNRGVTKTVHLVPKEAEVTKGGVNKFEEERKKMAEAKEDLFLNRFCDGKDNAWRPDSFFSEACTDGGGEVPPWPIRPTELFTNPHICMRIMARTHEEKNKKKTDNNKSKKEKKKVKDKKSKQDKKEKKGKKDKKEKKGKKDKKSKKDRKEKKAKRAREASGESGSAAPDLVEVGSDDCQQEVAPGGSPPAASGRSRSRSSSSSSKAESCSADFGGASSPS